MSITFQDYAGECDIPTIMALVAPELSEPYSIFTYRYFLHNWPELTILALLDNKPVGCIVCKVDKDKEPPIEGEPIPEHGYIGMLTVDKTLRRSGIGSKLVNTAIERMQKMGCASVMLETEITNVSGIRLYEKIGFIREELLICYYLNWNDAYRLRLHFKEEERAIC